MPQPLFVIVKSFLWMTESVRACVALRAFFITFAGMTINDETIGFIRAHRLDDVRALALRHGQSRMAHGADGGIDLQFALEQIAGWQTARKKIPTWADTDGVVYPPHLNMEQCSSEAAARYKAALVSRLVAESCACEACDDVAAAETRGGGQDAIAADARRLPAATLVDLTGGLGVDFSFMSRAFGHAVYVERNERLCAIARCNFGALGIDNAEVVCGDGVEYLRAMGNGVTEAPCVIFVDPARRDANGRKVFGIGDCVPDVLSIKNELLSKSACVVIKLSPMLDWHAAAKAFGDSCREVHIVSVANECKELLLVLGGSPISPDGGVGDGSVKLFCVNDNQVFAVDAAGSPNAGHGCGGCYGKLPAVPRFLFVPNASVMKAGCFAEVAVAFGMSMLDANSHLFVSDNEVDGFPGRRFRIIATTTMNKRELKSKLANISQANISVRNFPLSAVELRKRLKLKDGGDIYLFATTCSGRHVIMITSCG